MEKSVFWFVDYIITVCTHIHKYINIFSLSEINDKWMYTIHTKSYFENMVVTVAERRNPKRSPEISPEIVLKRIRA